jgi:hypothetical protein
MLKGDGSAAAVRTATDVTRHGGGAPSGHWKAARRQGGKTARKVAARVILALVFKGFKMRFGGL